MAGPAAAPSSYWDLISSYSAVQRRELALLKRLVDLLAGDPAFREAVKEGAPAARAMALDLGCGDVPEDLPDLCRRLAGLDEAGAATDRRIDLWRRFGAARTALRQLTVDRAGGPTSPPFDRWRSRQRARLRSEIGCASDVIPHSLFAFELSRGCSVGCSFCGIDAAKFGGAASYDEWHLEWLGMLRGLADRFGDALGSGFLYWGTDPLDNPDYVEFAQAFHSVCGLEPQITTAIPLRNQALTCRILDRAAQATLVPHRFSILSLNVLRRVLRTFTAEQTLHVELIMQHREAGALKANAGRAYYGKPNPVYLANDEGPETLVPTTIACVTGFLVNIAERRVRMISPTAASAAWPNGYIVFDDRTYSDCASFLLTIDEMVRDQVSAGIEPGSRLRFRRDLSISRTNGGFELSSPAMVHSFRAYGELAALLQSGERSVGELLEGAGERGASSSEEAAFLHGIYNAGLVEIH